MVSYSLNMKQMDKKDRAEIRLQKQIARDRATGGRSNAAIATAATNKVTIDDEIRKLQTEMNEEIYSKKWIDPAGVEFDQPISATKEELISIVSYNVLGPLHGESSKHDYADTKGIFVTLLHFILFSMKYTFPRS